MARRNCREENGEIRFDYDMAIAEPFKSLGVDSGCRPLAILRGAGPKAAARHPGEKSDLLTPKRPRRCSGWRQR